MKRGDRVFAFVGLGLSFWLIVESFKYDYLTTYTPGPGFHPFWLGVCLGMLSLLLLYSTFKRKDRKEDRQTQLPKKKALLRVGLILLFTLGFALSMTRLGIVLTVAAFVFVILFLLERYSLFKSFLYALIMSGAVLLIFRYWLETDLPKGWLGL